MLLGAVGEWILGNTYPFVVFGTFGAFWLSFGGTLQPDFNAYGAYSPDPSNPAAGLTTVGFNSSFGTFVPFLLSPPSRTNHVARQLSFCCSWAS